MDWTKRRFEVANVMEETGNVGRPLLEVVGN